MNFETTAKLLEVLKSYTENSVINISTDNKDWRGRDYKSDIVTIDEGNCVAFEVFDNEIIVFYFTDHAHFVDYSELEDGQADYVKRAKDFLKELFEFKIRHIEYYKGKNIYLEKYFIVYNDGKKDELISNTWYGLSKLINPFLKRTMQSTTWQFDKSKGVFTTREPKKASTDAIEVIDISEDCYVEIFKSRNGYSYSVEETTFDDYYGMHFWTPAFNIIPSGLYDTKEKAVNAAMYALKCREGQK